VTIELPGNDVEKGSELKVVVLTDDLSGVKKVEAVIETVGSANANAEDVPWQQAQTQDGVTWVATLKTDEVLKGTYRVLVRATDEVDNVTETPSAEAVPIVDKRPEVKLTPEQLKQSKATTVSGRVVYYGEPIAEAEVMFTDPAPAPAVEPVKSDSTGRYSFAKVPPGKYKLKALGRVKGYRRVKEVDVEVPEAPQKPAPVVIDLRPSRAR
jgi:hypothetical protein